MFFKRKHTSCSWISWLIPILGALVGLVLFVRPVLAHDGSPHAQENWWFSWSFEPGVILLVATFGVLYARGLRVRAHRGSPTQRKMKRQAWAYWSGLAVIFTALVSPVDALASELFWVHMLQHNLFILAAAPLLALAYPLPGLLLGMPPAWRRNLGRSWRRAAGLRAVWGVISSPPVAWLVQAVLLWLWHMPVFYEASVRNDAVHALQHASFLGSALLFWWVILKKPGVRSMQRGLAVLYLFTTGLHTGLLGALLTFSTRLWYPVYDGRSEPWGISPLADQQLAGTIMWVPGGMVYLLAALWLLKSWLDAMETPELHRDT